MKRYLILFLFLATNVYAAPPARVSTYTPNTVIASDAVTGNEDAIFNYLQAGVDTYKDGTIVNADVNSSANIQSSKLNLQNVAQAVLINSSGSLEVDGSTTLDGSLDVNGTSTFAGTTITDLGSVTTADINGGTIDGTTIGGSSAGAVTGTTITATTLKVGTTNQGDILYDNGTSFVRLTPGTSGQVLETQGAGANPQWANQGLKLLSTTTLSAAANSGDISLDAEKLYFVKVDLTRNTAGIVELRFNSNSTATAYAWNISELTMDDTSPARTETGDNSDDSIQISGSLTNSSVYTSTFHIDTFGGITNAFVNGTGFYNNSSSGNNINFDFFGTWSAATPSSFEIFVGTGSLTGNIYVYEYTK